MDEADENIGKIGLGLDVVQFAGLYQRRDDGPIFSTIIVTGEESILARQSLWAHRTLDDVGVELDAAIVEEAGEAVPVPEAVADDPGCTRYRASWCSKKILSASTSGRDLAWRAPRRSLALVPRTSFWMT